MNRQANVEIWQLRARFAAAHPEAQRPGPLDRVSAERRGALRVGHGYPTKSVVYQHVLPAPAAGIFYSDLEADAAAHSCRYSQALLSGAISCDLHDPSDLYQKAAP